MFLPKSTKTTFLLWAPCLAAGLDAQSPRAPTAENEASSGLPEAGAAMASYTMAFPGGLAPETHLRQEETPPAGDGCSSGRTSCRGCLGMCLPVCFLESYSLFSTVLPRRHSPGSFHPALYGCCSGRYPNSRLQPLGCGGFPGLCDGVYCPAFSGRSIAGLPAPPAGAL